MQGKTRLEQVANCAMCANMCKYACPTYAAVGRETITPQKIARLILYHEKGLLEDERGFFDVMFQSTMCGACQRHCIYDDYDLRRFILKGRAEAFLKGAVSDVVRQRVEIVGRYGNPHGERQLIERGTGDVGHFVSCSAYKDHATPDAMWKIISLSGRQVRQFGGADLCCGGPLYYAGDMEGFEKAAQRLQSEIRKMGLRTVTTDCPNCMKMMTEVYAEVGIDLGVEMLHTTEFLDGILEEGAIGLETRRGTATYHDPCILANDINVMSAPRRVIEALGFEIREPVYSGEHAHCCGGLPGARVGDTALAGAVASMRIAELRATAADVYVTACSSCKAVLSDLGMMDIAELVAEQTIG